MKNLNAIIDAMPMPMLLLNDRFEVIRTNAALRSYCVGYDETLDIRCGAILRCTNARRETDGCGRSPACQSCCLMRALRETALSKHPRSGETVISTIGAEGRITDAWLMFSVAMITINDTDLLLTSFMDITASKQIEKKLLTREQEFRALVENSPDAIARYDRLCRRTYVNPALERLAGKSAALLVGKNPADAFVADPHVGRQVADAVSETFAKGAQVNVELAWKDEGGKPHYYQSSFVPECDETGEMRSVLSISRDITSLRTTEAMLLHSQKMESIGTLAGGLAHDFNNLLTVIGGYSELLAFSLQGDEGKLSYAYEITETVKRGAELTRGLLAFSGKHETKKTRIDLNQIVSDLRKSISRLLRTDINLSFELCPEPLPIFADRVQIEQVLINLMVNSRDALCSGGAIDVYTSVVSLHKETISEGVTLHPGSYAVVEVTDNGEGMDEKTAARIFEPFFTTKEIGKGTGLGLSIAFGIVGSHNGCISVASEPGKGSRFRIYLPLYPGEETTDHSPVPEEIGIYGTETVLVVDDDPTIQSLLRELLENFGYTVLTASNGEEALEVFESHRDDIRIMVTDLIMPRLNGREAIELIRREKPKLPVILMSGHTYNCIDHEAIEQLNIVFMQKPVSHRRLLETMRSKLGNSTPEYRMAEGSKQ
ncbi:blue-light-activated protein [Geobacter sp. OR-1]|uniref:hybrid sensor histidine kinase/response regulator n=1 Tax=Geobacter sp. OR-1 TaxID=1266765 RepID=UPI0005425077|nr:response regulator [Geobacter sp. OR-1]GAM10779.1 blue-light-activated protein [Geobacter sp. OR-1]